jgi:hypothetical protein
MTHLYDVYPATVHSTGGSYSPDVHDFYEPVRLHYDYNVVFPGFGEPKDTCGKFKSVIACPNHPNGFKVLQYGCYRAECPVCYQRSCWRDAERITNRIVQWAKLTGAWRSWKHIILSPPQEWAKELIQTPEGYDKLFHEAIKLLKKYGITAGLIIIHPKRKTGDKASIEWRDGIHFHIYGYGFLLKSDEFYEKSGGWVYKNKGRARRLKGLIFYLLTHRGLMVDRDRNVIKKSVRWFGDLALNRMKGYKECEVRTVKCKECGEWYHEYELNDDGKWNDVGIFFYTVRFRVYETAWRGGRQYSSYSEKLGPP